MIEFQKALNNLRFNFLLIYDTYGPADFMEY